MKKQTRPIQTLQFSQDELDGEYTALETFFTPDDSTILPKGQVLMLLDIHSCSPFPLVTVF